MVSKRCNLVFLGDGASRYPPAHSQSDMVSERLDWKRVKSRCGLRTVLKSPPFITRELGTLAGSENSMWKNLGESVLAIVSLVLPHCTVDYNTVYLPSQSVTVE